MLSEKEGKNEGEQERGGRDTTTAYIPPFASKFERSKSGLFIIVQHRRRRYAIVVLYVCVEA